MNNVEAAIVLLKNGANKDMQNNKVDWGKKMLFHLFGAKALFLYIEKNPTPPPKIYKKRK